MFQQALFPTLLCVFPTLLVPLHSAQLDVDVGDVSPTSCAGINQIIWVTFVGSNFNKNNAQL